MHEEIVLMSGVRTAVGKFGHVFKEVPAQQLVYRFLTGRHIKTYIQIHHFYALFRHPLRYLRNSHFTQRTRQTDTSNDTTSQHPLFIRSMISTAPLLTALFATTYKAISCNPYFLT